MKYIMTDQYEKQTATTTSALAAAPAASTPASSQEYATAQENSSLFAGNQPCWSCQNLTPLHLLVPKLKSKTLYIS